MGRLIMTVGACLISLATTATAQPWNCTVWQWQQSAKLSIGAFTVDPATATAAKVAIDADTTASCSGQSARSGGQSLLVCAVYTASTRYAARGTVTDDSRYLLVSGNQTDTLVDNQIECTPAAGAAGR